MEELIMANCNSSRNNTNAAVTTATTCNEAGESILKSITKGNKLDQVEQ